MTGASEKVTGKRSSGFLKKTKNAGKEEGQGKPEEYLLTTQIAIPVHVKKTGGSRGHSADKKGVFNTSPGHCQWTASDRIQTLADSGKREIREFGEEMSTGKVAVTVNEAHHGNRDAIAVEGEPQL